MAATYSTLIYHADESTHVVPSPDNHLSLIDGAMNITTLDFTGLTANQTVALIDSINEQLQTIRERALGSAVAGQP